MHTADNTASAVTRAYLQIFWFLFSDGWMVFFCAAGVWSWYRHGIQWEIRIMNYGWALSHQVGIVKRKNLRFLPDVYFWCAPVIWWSSLTVYIQFLWGIKRDINTWDGLLPWNHKVLSAFWALWDIERQCFCIPYDSVHRTFSFSKESPKMHTT